MRLVLATKLANEQGQILAPVYVHYCSICHSVQFDTLMSLSNRLATTCDPINTRGRGSIYNHFRKPSFPLL